MRWRSFASMSDNLQHKLGGLLTYSQILENEFVRAKEHKLWLAALTTGQSLLECLLLMRALSSVEVIRERTQYREVTVSELCSRTWSISRLLRVAWQLSWLDVQYIPEEIVSTISAELSKHTPDIQLPKDSSFVPSLLLFLLKDKRNLIHPGKMSTRSLVLREDEFNEEAEGYTHLLTLLLQCVRWTQIDVAFDGIK